MITRSANTAPSHIQHCLCNRNGSHTYACCKHALYDCATICVTADVTDKLQPRCNMYPQQGCITVQRMYIDTNVVCLRPMRTATVNVPMRHCSTYVCNATCRALSLRAHLHQAIPATCHGPQLLSHFSVPCLQHTTSRAVWRSSHRGRVCNHLPLRGTGLLRAVGPHVLQTNAQSCTYLNGVTITSSV